MPDNELMLKIRGDVSGAKTALTDLEKSLGQTGKTTVGLGQKIMSGFAALGLGAFLKESVDAAMAMEAANARLRASVEATGASWATYGDEMIRTVDASALASGFDDKEMTGALSNLTMMTGSASKAMEDLSLSQDLARSTGMSLEAASKLVAKVEEGRIGIVARVLPFLKATMTTEEALAEVREHTAGQAAAYAATTAGQIDRAKVALDQFQEALGGAVLPALGQLSEAGAEALHGFQEWPEPLRTATVDVGGLTISVGALALALKSVGLSGAAAAVSGWGAIAVGTVAAGAGIAYVTVKLLEMIPGQQATMEASRQFFERLRGGVRGAIDDYDSLTDASGHSALGTSWLGDAVRKASADADALTDATIGLTEATKGYTDALVYEINNLTQQQTAHQTFLQDRIAVKAATQAVADAVKKYGKNSDEAKLALLNLTAAQNKAKDSAAVAKGDLSGAGLAAKNSGTNAGVAATKWLSLSEAIQRASARAVFAAGNMPRNVTTPGGHAMGGINPGIPQLTMFGEGGYPETIFSWDPAYRARSLALIGESLRGMGVASAAAGGVGAGGGGTTVINHFAITANVSNDYDVDQLAERLHRIQSTRARAIGATA